MKLIEPFWIGSYEPVFWLPGFLQLVKDTMGISVVGYRYTDDTGGFPCFYEWDIEGTEEELDIFRFMFDRALEHNQ